MKFITIDGVDKSGKSALISKLFLKTNGLVYMQDRSLSGWNFFNSLLYRNKDNSSYYKEYKQKLKTFRKVVDLSIILEVNEKDWLARCKEAKEPELVGNLSFKDHQKELINEFNKAKYPNVLRLNTSELSEEDCINMILKRLGIY